MSRQPYRYERVMAGGEMDPSARQNNRMPPPQYQSPAPMAYRQSPHLNPGDVAKMRVVRCPDNSLTLTNLLAVSAADFGTNVRHVKVNDQFIFNIQPVQGMESGLIGPSRIQRTWAELSINQQVLVEAIADPATDPQSSVHLISMDVEVSFNSPSQEQALRIDSEEMSALLRTNFSNQLFCLGQPFVFDFRGNNLKGHITNLAVVPLDVLRDGKSAGDAGVSSTSSNSAAYGILSSLTAINVLKGPGTLIELHGSATKRKANAIIQPDFKFEDMGIGGLDKEFSNIFRRAFASRIFPPDLVDKLGIQHVKGILLYGPPGTGKTLMARQIGKMLNAVDPLIVSGPEILNKYVGQSEENVRKLFEPAEKEYKEKGDESQLHIIIFDELDAICKQRGSKNDGTGVGDSV
ncbi:transport between ER and Golgi ATPase protein, partial [Dipsacomyces acuminosporus]